MKKTILYLIIASMPILCYSQKHVKGMKDISLGGGITQLGYYVDMGFHKITSQKVKMGANIAYEQGNYETYKFSSVYLFTEIRYSPFHIKEVIFFNLGGGPVVNYNMIDLSQTLEGQTKKTAFNYGVSAFVEPEIYLSDKVILYLMARQAAVFGKVMGTGIFFAGGGLKVSF
jgi:hypothetical protein